MREYWSTHARQIVPAKNGQVQKKGHHHPMELDTRDILRVSIFGTLSLPPVPAGAK